MDAAVEVKNAGLGTGASPSSYKLLFRWFLKITPLLGAQLFTYAFFVWPWSEWEAYTGINLVEAIFSIVFQGAYFVMPAVLLPLLYVYISVRDEKGLLLKLKEEGKANLPARLLLIALAFPFLGAVFLALTIVSCMAFIYVLWMGSGHLAESLRLLPGYGEEAFKQALWLVNLCLFHGVISMLLAWMATNARSEWQLGLKQKRLNLSCLVVFLVLYWQFSKHYGVGLAGLFGIYAYDPEVTTGAIAVSLLLLACSVAVVGFLSLRSVSASLRNVEQIALISLKGFSEERKKLASKVGYHLLAWWTVLFFVYHLGAGYR